MDPVDLQVYVDGGLIVRHVHPFYNPHAAAPLYDWGGYSSLALKLTYTPLEPAPAPSSRHRHEGWTSSRSRTRMVSGSRTRS